MRVFPIRTAGFTRALAICVPLMTAAAFADIPAPQTIDPDEPSGWISVELAVLIDDSPATLDSELWPHFPSPSYPNTFRRLVAPEWLAELRSDYPHSTVTTGPLGHITVSVPNPAERLLELQAAAEARLIPPLVEEDSVGIPMPPEDQTPLTPPPEPYPESALDSEPGNDPLPVDLVRMEPTEPPPALPTPFQTRPLEQLAEGLTWLTRNTANRLELATRWLQPPGAANIPIILDHSGDDRNWPPLQGFIELRRGDEMRLGINMWWQTQGSYYPASFTMNPPPRAPAQLTLEDSDSGQILSEAEASARNQLLEHLQLLDAAGLPTGNALDPLPSRLEPAIGTGSADWPYRHILHVADTRSIEERRIRYFDHPVIKVIATWRELSWGEVHELGASDQAADAEILDADSDTETDTAVEAAL